MTKQRTLKMWVSPPVEVLNRRGFLTVATVAGAALLTGCGLGKVSKGPAELLAWPTDNIWPELLAFTSVEVQETYHWAAKNKDTVQWFPCTCGCVDISDHTSNYECYVAEEYGDGSVLLDIHSFG